jgi:PHD/YefM family antitoxin component YafN of YafNO toxin-antitoxin module
MLLRYICQLSKQADRYLFLTILSKDALMNTKFIITTNDFKQHYDEFFDKALTEPVIIQKNDRNSLVIVALDVFQRLQDRLAELEDYKLLQEMNEIKKTGTFVSSDEAVQHLTLLIQE